MKYWIDTEFIAKPFAIDLVSIGLVAEDGREFYAESSEVDWSKPSPWMLENVRPAARGQGREPRGDQLRAPILHRSRRASRVLGLLPGLIWPVCISHVSRSAPSLSLLSLPAAPSP